MGQFAFLLFVAVATPAAVLCQSAGPPCEQWIFTNCLNSTETAYQKHINELDFAAACTAFAKVDSCYSSALNRPSCKNYTNVINGLKQKNQANLNSYCPNGQPDKCLQDLATCLQDYNKITDPNDKNLCATATKAQNCTNHLNCPASLSSMIGSKQLEITRKVLSSGCIQTNTKSPPCLDDAARCLDPLEKQTLQFEQNYDFAGLCEIWPQIQGCIDKLNNDKNCTSAKGALDARWNALRDRHQQYCDAQNKPVKCLQALQNCTDEYQVITASPQFSVDPLYLCQGLEQMVTCLGGVKADLSSCPGAAGIKAIASYQKDQAETNQTCSQILTPCTRDVSKCVLTTDIAVNDAMELADYDRVCELTDQLNGCIAKNSIDAQCFQNPFLSAEAAYVKNTSDTYCQKANDLKAKSCLEAVSSCASNWDAAAANFTSVDQLCKDQDVFVGCLDKITCKDSATQNQLVVARQKAQRDDCSGATVTMAAALTLLVATVMRLVVA